MKRLLNTLLLCGVVGVCAGQQDSTKVIDFSKPFDSKVICIDGDPPNRGGIYFFVPGQNDTTCSCKRIGIVLCRRIGPCAWPHSGNTSTTTFSIECVTKDRPPKPHNKFKEVARRVHYVKPRQ